MNWVKEPTLLKMISTSWCQIFLSLSLSFSVLSHSFVTLKILLSISIFVAWYLGMILDSISSVCFLISCFFAPTTLYNWLHYVLGERRIECTLYRLLDYMSHSLFRSVDLDEIRTQEKSTAGSFLWKGQCHGTGMKTHPRDFWCNPRIHIFDNCYKIVVTACHKSHSRLPLLSV